MRQSTLFFGIAAACLAGNAWGQAAPTATAGVQFSAFGGASGDYAGIENARNLSITAGLDATIRPFFGLFPTLEVRGTDPVDKGQVVSQKNVLGGLVLEKHFGRVQPYGNILVGRGAMQFVVPYPNPADNEVFEETVSTVISPGAGANFFFSEHFALKGDFQYQHYDSPVTSSGSAYAKVFTVGLTYRLPFGGVARGRRFR